jgi:hypothetical protein
MAGKTETKTCQYCNRRGLANTFMRGPDLVVLRLVFDNGLSIPTDVCKDRVACRDRRRSSLAANRKRYPDIACLFKDDSAKLFPDLIAVER